MGSMLKKKMIHIQVGKVGLQCLRRGKLWVTCNRRKHTQTAHKAAKVQQTQFTLYMPASTILGRAGVGEVAQRNVGDKATICLSWEGGEGLAHMPKAHRSM